MYEGIKVIKEVPHQGPMTEVYISKLFSIGWALIAIVPTKTEGIRCLDIVYVLGSDKELEWIDFLEVVPF